MNPAFSMQGIVKEYKDFTLGPLDLELAPGTVLGLVGPNGAGKTTAIHLLTGLVKANRGRMEIFGRPNDPERVDWKLEIGFVGDNPAFFENWTGRANLDFIAGFYPKWSPERQAELAGRFDLDLERKVRTLSRGNRVKLALVAALAHSPRLCLFDEPTSGLDPVVRTEVLDVLQELMMDEGNAILYSTHILTDIDRLADELAFLKNGRIIQRERKDILADRWRRFTFRLSGDFEPGAEITGWKREGEEHLVVSSDQQRTLATLERAAAGDVRCSLMSMEEIAVEILKRRETDSPGSNGPVHKKKEQG